MFGKNFEHLIKNNTVFFLKSTNSHNYIEKYVKTIVHSNNMAYELTIDIMNTTNQSIEVIDDTSDFDRYEPEMAQKLQLLWSIAFALIVLIAAGGNSIVIWIVLTNKQMRTVTNYFLVNLSITDIMTSICNVIPNVIFVLTSEWKFGRIYCRISSFVALLSLAASVFTLTAIAIDR